MTIRIVTDSSCDLPDSLIDELQIPIVPLSIRFGDEEFIDRVELSTSEFWRRCTSSAQLPETSAPAPGQFEQTYRQLKADGATGIVVINLSSQLSATMQSAELAARSVADDIDVRVVDSTSASMGVGNTVVAAARLAATGADLDTVEQAARDMANRTRLFAALDTLENLKKGGRIGGAQALLATALSIKPLLEVRGAVEQAGRQRTRSKALKFLVSKVEEHQGRIGSLSVLHAQCDDVDDFIAKIRPYYDGDIEVGVVGPVIGTHAGVGAMGVAFDVK